MLFEVFVMNAHYGEMLTVKPCCFQSEYTFFLSSNTSYCAIECILSNTQYSTPNFGAEAFFDGISNNIGIQTSALVLPLRKN